MIEKYPESRQVASVAAKVLTRILINANVNVSF
jgi:hypothetical protein